MSEISSWSDFEKAMAVGAVAIMYLAWHIHRLEKRVDALAEMIIELQMRN